MYKKIIAVCVLALTISGCSSENSSKSDAVNGDLSSQSVTTTTTTALTTTTTTQPSVITKPHNGLQFSKQLEVYSKATVGDLFKNISVKLDDSDLVLDTNSLGEKTIGVSYTYNNQKYNHDITYEVVDTTKPLLLNGGWNIDLEIGEEFNINDYIGYADNYDKKPAATYLGEVDTSKDGIYKIEVTVSDSSNNETKWEVNVNVGDVEIPDSPSGSGGTTKRVNFEDVVKDYSADNTSFGIDVSKWQGDIDFKAVKDAGCSFVIIRIGSYYDEYTPDPYFEANLKGAKDAGLKVGVYLYTTANTNEEVIDNAKWIVDKLNGEYLDFPIVFDWESFEYFQQYEMSIHDLNSYFESFSNELNKNGYSAMLYGSKNHLTNFWYDFDKYPVWLANYVSQTEYTGKYDMWQMTCFGRIQGIAGDVDINILYD